MLKPAATRRADGVGLIGDGFTVIEVTIAMAIMLTVLTIFLGLLVSLTRTERRSNALVGNEQAVRFVLDQVEKEVRAANPLDTFTTKAAYPNQIQVELGASGTTKTIIRWTYNTNPASTGYETLSRQVVVNGAVASSTVMLTRVRNVETGLPLFGYFGQHEQDLVAAANTPADVGNCSIRVHIAVRSDSNPGPLPFDEQVDVEIRNRLPGGVGCG